LLEDKLFRDDYEACMLELEAGEGFDALDGTLADELSDEDAA